MDRSIALWNVENERSIWHFPCIGGYVYDIKRFGDNEERLVIGAGDNVLRIWSPHNVENPFQMKTIWKGIHAKISVVSPHPALETIIAFGSEDGKIYWFDSRSDRQLTSKSIHKGTVYSLKWKSFGQDSWSLLSIGADSKVMRHDISLETMQVETLDFWRVIRSSNADIAEFDNLKPTDLDFHQDLLCIGFSNGRTGVFDVRTLRNRFLSSQQSKLINQVLWNRSSCQLVFGSGSADGSIAITTFDQDFHHDTIMLREHRDSVISIAWNENFLASCSKDSKILIWDSRSWKVVNSFAVSKGRVLCIEWSRRIPSVLFSGGDDQCVRAWDTRKVSSVETLPVQRPKPKPKAKKESSAQNLVSAVDSYRLLETPLCIEYDRYSDLSHFDCFQSSPLFNLDASPQDYLAEIRSTPTSLRDALFLMGDTRGSIEACLNNSSFSFLHLACSMKAGIPEWLSYSKAFAEKLRASGTLREAGYLFLAIDSLQEAIDCFLDGNYFVEALTAARFRTDLASNGLIRRIIFYWGMAQADNHPLFAAQCFVACNSVSNAIEVLTSSNHLDWWILAWKLSKQKWVANMLQVLLILYQCPQETLRDLALVTDQCVAHFSDFLQQVLSHSESELEHLSYPHASKILTCMIDLKRLNDFQLEPEIRKRLQAVYRALGE
jgi:WD40 repeat protein